MRKREVMADRIVEESINTVMEMTVMTEGGTGPEKGHSPEIMATMLETEVHITFGSQREHFT